METLDKFSKWGFLYQTPSNTDKTYFFVRHTDSTTEQLWVQLKKIPEVEYKVNNKQIGLNKQLTGLVGEFLSELGYKEYAVVGE